MRKPLFAVAALACLAGATTVTATQLPTGWTISPPQSAVARVGLWPQGIALSPDGSQLAVVDSGVAGPDVRILDAATLQPKTSIDMTGVFGRPVWIDATHLLLAGQNTDAAFIVDTATQHTTRIDVGAKTWPSAVALAPDRVTAATSNDLAASISLFSLESPHPVAVHVGEHPSDLAFSPDGKTLYVALRAESSVAAVNVATHAVRTFKTGRHPDALLAHGHALAVANADDDSLSILDTVSGKTVATVDLRLHGPDGSFVYGASPNSLAADDAHIYATLGEENALAVVDMHTDVVTRIPTGWYPSSVAVTRDGRLFVSDAKGETAPANPQFKPFAHGARDGYTGTSLFGTVRMLHVADALGERDFTARSVPAASHESSIVRANGPIRHVIYVIKENRTYDQVLGDLPAGDGDAGLTMFGAQITPNEHAIASHFGIFDNLYASAQVSADGHNWSTAALANDYLERMWPSIYGQRRQLYDFEDGASASTPHNGYLWDDAARAHITLRDYGEFVTNPDVREGDATTEMANLKGHIDPHYPGFDLEISDLDRMTEWKREFDGYVRDGNLPQLEIIRLPNDHTEGTRAGTLTPQAYVAQNDEAVGRLVEAVSHSRYWQSTAIFIIEDDAQNGADHVSNQRTTFYLASAYAKGGVQHQRYSTTSVLHTIEVLLGMAPMSAYDAYAPLMTDAFAETPSQSPYDRIAPKIDLKATNVANGYGSQRSARMDFSRADDVDADELNDILEHVTQRKP